MFHCKRPLFALLAVLTVSGCKTVPPPRLTTLEPHKGVFEAPRAKYLSKDMVLYSVEMRTWGWRFLLMPVEFEPSHACNYNDLYRASELPKVFSMLPKRTRVTWSDNPDKLWMYPPQSIEKWVERAAKRAGIEFSYNPWIAAEPGEVDLRFSTIESNEWLNAIKRCSMGPVTSAMMRNRCAVNVRGLPATASREFSRN